MPAAATIAETPNAAMTVVRLERPSRFAARRRAPVSSISGDAAVDFSEPRFFPERCLERATSLATRDRHKLKIVHVLGGRECPHASGTVASCIETLGAR